MTTPKRGLKFLFVIALLAGLGALLVWAFIEGRQEFLAEQERERPVRAPSRLSIEEGESVVRIDPATQARSGIGIALLTSTTRQEELKAYGTVVAVQGLADLRNAYIAAHAQLVKTQASVETTRKEYERLTALHKLDRNISDKDIQAVKAAVLSDEANYWAAQESVQTLKGAIRQQWGGVLAGELFEASPAFMRLIEQQDVLVQLTLPVGTPLSAPPKTATVRMTDSARSELKLLSPAPRTDLRLQGVSLFYLAPAKEAGLLPGMNAVAYLPIGAPIPGVVIPHSSVVGWQGRTWVYVEKGEGRFVRRVIAADWPVEAGWFVTHGLESGDRIVTSGAQLLLSEEGRAQIQIGEEEKSR
jgi:hypothetical protein